LTLAISAMLGIVGMLVLDGIGSVAAFVFAAMPLLAGVWGYASQRSPRPEH
jgi:hypothetical protein